MPPSGPFLQGVGLLLLLVAVTGAFVLQPRRPGLQGLVEAVAAKRGGQKTNNASPHSEDPEIAVCDKQLKRGEKCGSRPLCCQGSSCQMFNSFYRTFMDCPHGVKNQECFCIEESLASRTDFSEYWQ